MSRDFNEWLSKFKRSISGYGYLNELPGVDDVIELIGNLK